jgi:competence CoiA-like predicted nuclease
VKKEKGDKGMLIALDKKNHQVNLYDFIKSENPSTLKRNGPYFCPTCKSPVILKNGTIKRPHFSHIHLSDCKGRYSESSEHYDGKYDLYRFFKNLGFDVEIEKYLSQIDQRPDIVVQHQMKKLCIEYQCASIPLSLLIKRTEAYQSLSLQVFWILGMKMFKQNSKNTYSLNSISVYCMLKENHYSIIYYSPIVSSFIIISSLISFSTKQYIGKKTIIPFNQCRFSNLVSQSKICKEEFVNSWCHLKKRYRLSQHLNYKGNFYQLKEMMYLLKMDYFPSEIGVPLKCNCLIHEHCVLYLKFIHQEQIGQVILVDDIKYYLILQVTKKNWKTNLFQRNEFIILENCVENYIDYLVQYGIVKRLKNGKIMKIAYSSNPSSLLSALDDDRNAARIAYHLL